MSNALISLSESMESIDSKIGVNFEGASKEKLPVELDGAKNADKKEGCSAGSINGRLLDGLNGNSKVGPEGTSKAIPLQSTIIRPAIFSLK